MSKRYGAPCSTARSTGSSAITRVVRRSRSGQRTIQPTFGWPNPDSGAPNICSGVLSEGSKRGMSYNHMAELLSFNPAQRFGLLGKGDIAPGYDADIVLVDPGATFVVHAAESESHQGYTPFEGVELSGRVKSTFLRGSLIYDNGKVVGSARGEYLQRPRTATPKHKS